MFRKFKKFLVYGSLASLLACSTCFSAFATAIKEEGKASWLGARMQGKKTASGELFDMNELVGAHASVPLGEYVRVTSKTNGKSVTVKITDRLDYNTGRVIDISKRAAQEIGLDQQGIGVVTVESLGKSASTTTSSSNTSNSSNSSSQAYYEVQYGSFSDIQNAQQLQTALNTKGIASSLETSQQNNKTFFRVNGTSKYLSEEEAMRYVLVNAPEFIGDVLVSKVINESSQSQVNNTNANNNISQQKPQLVGVEVADTLYGFSASHVNLPLGEYVKVTSQSTGKYAILKVTNKFYGNNGRSIAISQSVANKIGVPQVGYVTVEALGKDPNNIKFLETLNDVISEPSGTDTDSSIAIIHSDPNDPNQYRIQYGSFGDVENAQILQNALLKKNIESVIQPINQGERQLFRVYSKENYKSKQEAKCRVVLDAPEYGIVRTLSETNPSKPNTANNKPANTVNNNVTSVSNNGKYEYGLQFGAFKTMDNAKQLGNQLMLERSVKTIIYQFPDDNKHLYRVLSNSPFPSREAASTYLKSKNLAETEASILTFLKE